MFRLILFPKLLKANFKISQLEKELKKKESQSTEPEARA